MLATKSMRRFRRSVLQVGEFERRSPAALRGAATDVVMLSRFYYLFLAFNIGTSGGLHFPQASSGRPPTSPLWPIDVVQWLTGPGWFAHDRVVTVVGLLVAIAAAGSPRFLLWRLGSFAYLLIQVALANSYGAINHGSHVVLFVGFALLFLPRGNDGSRMARKDVLSYLTVLWFAQGLILLSYTLSGFWKLWHSRLEVFSTDAMSRILLDRALLEADNIPVLLPFVVQHNWLAQSMWWLTLYIEIVALLVVFRPHLHRLFGAVLILFHITSAWLMNIWFSLNIVMLGLFLLLSPLAPVRFSLSGTVRSLPIVGLPFRAMRRRQQSRQPRHTDRVWLVYDGECPMCNNYAQYLRLQQMVGEFVLLDARQGGPVVDEVRRLPHDLNDGMVVKIGDRFYIGAEALNVLALLSTDRGAFNKFNRLAFSSPLISRFTYPLMKAARWALLKLKGVAPITGDS